MSLTVRHKDPHTVCTPLGPSTCLSFCLDLPILLLPTTWPTSQTTHHCPEVHIYAYLCLHPKWMIDQLCNLKHFSLLLYFRVASDWACSAAVIHYLFTSTQEPDSGFFLLYQPVIEKALWGHRCELKERPYCNNRDWGTGSCNLLIPSGHTQI